MSGSRFPKSFEKGPGGQIIKGPENGSRQGGLIQSNLVVGFYWPMTGTCGLTGSASWRTIKANVNHQASLPSQDRCLMQKSSAHAAQRCRRMPKPRLLPIEDETVGFLIT